MQPMDQNLRSQLSPQQTSCLPEDVQIPFKALGQICTPSTSLCRRPQHHRAGRGGRSQAWATTTDEDSEQRGVWITYTQQQPIY